MCIFFEYEHLKRFVWKDDNIFVYEWQTGNQGTFFEMVVIGGFCMCTKAEIRQFLHFMIEPV